MTCYTVTIHDHTTGEPADLEIVADSCDIFNNGTLVIKAGNAVVFAAVQQSWSRVWAEEAEEPKKKRR